MNELDLMRVGSLPSFTNWPQPVALPSSPPPPASPRRQANVPLCHAWGAHGDIHGVVQRDANGITETVIVNRGRDRETFEIEGMTAALARERAVRLIQQADAWDREFGNGARP